MTSCLKTLPVLLAAAVFVFTGRPAPARGEAVTVADGDVRPVIVAPAAPEDQVAFAVDDLQHYLQRLTGREVALVREEENAVPPPADTAVFYIHVGPVAANAGLPAVIAEEELGRDGFVLEVSAAGVRILGGSKFGTGHGVYEFLERLGVRWLFPGAWGEVVPARQRLTLAAGRFTDRPAFLVRQMHTAWVGEEAGHWFRRMRHNRSGFFGHAGGGLRGGHRRIRAQWWEKHPEWFAEIDGERRFGTERHPHNFKLCHANREMVAQAIADTLAQIRERKADPAERRHIGYRHLAEDYFILSIDPTDGGGYCRCEACLAMGSLSDRLLGHANEIAAAVREEFPGYYVGYYCAYSEHQLPPEETAAAPGVFLFMTTWVKRHFEELSTIANRSFRERVAAFAAVSQEMAMRDFDGMTRWWGHYPVSKVEVNAADYQWYHQQGIRGIVTEAHINWGPWGYHYYMMSRLWWNPYADVAALREDFVRAAYGRAYEPMLRYHQRLDRARVNLDPATLHAMRLDLEAAARLARRDDVRARLDALRAYYFLLDIYEKHRAGEAGEEEHALVSRVYNSLDRHVISRRRTRIMGSFTYDSEVPPLDREELRTLLDGVTLAPPGKSWPAWSDGDDLLLEPLVAAPADEEWAAGPAVTADLPRGAQWAQRFRFGPHTMLIHAAAGERIRIWSSGRVSSFELQDPMHQAVASGVGVEDRVGEDKALVDMTAPAAGIYTFTFASGPSRIHVSNRAAVIKAGSADQDVHVHHWSTHYFYVPPGTAEFAFFLRPHGVGIIEAWLADQGPSFPVHHRVTVGEPVYRAEQRSPAFEEHRIRVPEGGDGRVWAVRFGNRGDGKKQVYLVGVPPFLAEHPDRLLALPGD